MSITSTRLSVSLGVMPLPMLSCQEINPEFCTDHPGDAVCFAKGSGMNGSTGLDGGGGDGGIDAVKCTSNAQCASPTPICDMTRSMCVQCTAAEPSACGGTTPRCGDDDTCRGCAMDSECESLTCLPDGSCAAAINVLHVVPTASSTARIDPLAPHMFEFDTVAFNETNTDGTPGVNCLDAGNVLFASNILFENSATFVMPNQVTGDNSCRWAYSNIGPVPQFGTNNLAGDPQFVDPTHSDFHLQATSSARSTADPTATLANDIDGEVRPQGPGRDMGADEIK